MQMRPLASETVIDDWLNFGTCVHTITRAIHVLDGSLPHRSRTVDAKFISYATEMLGRRSLTNGVASIVVTRWYTLRG